MNLSRSLSETCPLHRPHLTQKQVVIADNAGTPALNNVYLGFTNGQTGSVRQSIVVSNFQARVQ